jgi:hypothetical protein
MVLFLVLMGCPAAPHTMNEGWVYTLEDEDLDSEGLTESDDEETEEDTVVEDESVPDGLVVGEDELEDPYEEPEEPGLEYSEGCSDAEYDGHSYVFCDFSLTRPEAQDECIDMGLLLVEIGDAAENQWVVEQSLERVAGNIWLGLKKSHAGNWYWPSRETPPYRKWHPGEPNDAAGMENCAEMYLGGIEEWQLGKWNDTSCGLGRRFVCEQVDID